MNECTRNVKIKVKLQKRVVNGQKTILKIVLVAVRKVGDKVNSGMELSYRHARLQGWWAGMTLRRPYAGVDFILQSGIYEFG
jgi:hypothetical protein